MPNERNAVKPRAEHIGIPRWHFFHVPAEAMVQCVLWDELRDEDHRFLQKRDDWLAAEHQRIAEQLEQERLEQEHSVEVLTWPIERLLPYSYLAVDALKTHMGIADVTDLIVCTEQDIYHCVRRHYGNIGKCMGGIKRALRKHGLELAGYIED